MRYRGGIAPARCTELANRGPGTDEVLREIGFDADAIAALHTDGVVKIEMG